MQPNLTPVQIQPDTRNHQGYFLPEDTFYLVGQTPSGWAHICSDVQSDGYTRCHLVNPDDLRPGDF